MLTRYLLDATLMGLRCCQDIGSVSCHRCAQQGRGEDGQGVLATRRLVQRLGQHRPAPAAVRCKNLLQRKTPRALKRIRVVLPSTIITGWRQYTTFWPSCRSIKVGLGVDDSSSRPHPVCYLDKPPTSPILLCLHTLSILRPLSGSHIFPCAACNIDTADDHRYHGHTIQPKQRTYCITTAVTRSPSCH